MKQPIKGIIKQADHNPVRVGDKILITHQPSTGGGGGVRGPGKKKQSLRELFIEFKDELNKRFDNLEVNQKQQGKQITNLNNKVDTIIQLNELKTK